MSLIEMEVSSVMEEYLEAIYRLEEKMGSVKTSDLAKQMKVTFGTITNTVENLERKGLVIHEPYRGVKLTEEGERLALDVLRRHRLCERLLTDILRMDWSKVHDAACKLEHAVTEVTKPLEKTLGHPKTCPHGNPIPTECGDVIEEESEPLVNLELRERGTMVKIIEERTDVLQYLASLGLIPGESFEVKEKIPFDGTTILEVRGKTSALGPKIASIVHVKKTNQ